MSTTAAQISAWGNGLALRLTKPMAKTAGLANGSPVRVTVKPGRIVIETEVEPTLEKMLAAFDPKRHGGEVMADRPMPGLPASRRDSRESLKRCHSAARSSPRTSSK